MMEISRWQIWWASVVFEDDPTQAKRRPVLVFNVNSEELYVLAIKLTKHESRSDIPGCRPDYELVEWAAAGLKVPTTARLSKVLRLTHEDFGELIGVLHPIDRYRIIKLINT